MRNEMPPTMHEDTSLTRRASLCSHGRIVDDVLSSQGAKTGQLVCLECQAVFPDPSSPHPSH